MSAKMTRFWLCLGLLLALPVQAEWQWSAAVPLGVAGSSVFPHLDASGRKSIAVSGPHVALVWEDSRLGSPRCWLAWKSEQETSFHELEFGRGECFSPAIAGASEGRFLLAWEDEEGVKAAVLAQAILGAPLKLAGEGGHATIIHHPGLGAFVAWTALEGRWRRISLARLALGTDSLTLLGRQAADPQPPVDDQLYPVLAASKRGVTLAWEDRRLGHTVVFEVHSADGQVWSVPARISQNPTGKAQGNLGRGTGAMRPSLAGFNGRLAAVWLDKRDFLSGYDVYAALEESAGFGKNSKAQDSFGDSMAQWHAAISGNTRGDLVIAFDDERDGSADVWLTWWSGQGFADNLSPPPAAGAGAQSDPVIALDEQGNLHLAWLARSEAGEQLFYAIGTRPQTANSGSEKAR
jgi:hypothetical protein